MKAHQNNPALSSFPHDVPSPVFLASALEGRRASRTYPDPDSRDPVAEGAIMSRASDGLTYCGRGVTQDFFERTVREIQELGDVFLVMSREQESSFSWSAFPEPSLRRRTAAVTMR